MTTLGWLADKSETLGHVFNLLCLLKDDYWPLLLTSQGGALETKKKLTFVTEKL